MKQKLIESYVPKLWMANTADDIRKILNDYSDAYDSINCLEAKPKALHSMKCDGKVCKPKIVKTKGVGIFEQSVCECGRLV